MPLTVSCGWCAPNQHSRLNGSSCGTRQVATGIGCVSSVMSTIHRKALGDGVSRSGDLLVGDDGDLAAHQLVRDRQHGVGRARVGRAPVEAADIGRVADVVDVEDHEAAVPITRIEPVAAPQRVMAAVPPALPGRRLAACGPLPRHPPAGDRLGPGRVGEIEDHDDVADIAVLLGRDVGIAPVRIEAVRAAAICNGPIGRGLVRSVMS